MLRNIYTTNINNEVLSLAFGHHLKKKNQKNPRTILVFLKVTELKAIQDTHS